MKDSRLWQIRSLTSEAAQIAAELRNEINPGTAEDRSLETLATCLSWAIDRTKVLEEM